MMEYEEIELIKRSEEGIVQLVKGKDTGKLFIRKVRKGQPYVYFILEGCTHPYLPKIYEISTKDGVTTIIEEYIEGQPIGYVHLSKKQFLSVVKDLCAVLEFLHKMNIIHRDLKPSNIIYAEDGHIRLIDFDAARMVKGELEQDTRLLGTKGYAPPEQYGFAQTDARTDIFALGVTLEQILEDKIQKLCYKRIIRKCTNLDPKRRYQSVRQVRNAFLGIKWYGLCGGIMLAFAIFSCGSFQNEPMEPKRAAAQRHPDQILWGDVPVHEYVGRYIDDIVEEMDVPYDTYTDGGSQNRCSYRNQGIVFFFDDKHIVSRIAMDPAVSTFNGESLDVNQEKLIEMMGNPTFAGWKEKKDEADEDIYYVDFYDSDAKWGAVFYMPSPEEEAYVIYID
ncbi:MAG: serine/threonine protein kinase [Lachnospiraceae bacterium]|nr:serine/threonine protein kinase [Lachnospiraceae bacterium]